MLPAEVTPSAPDCSNPVTTWKLDKSSCSCGPYSEQLGVLTVAPPPSLWRSLPGRPFPPHLPFAPADPGVLLEQSAPPKGNCNILWLAWKGCGFSWR